MSTTMVYIIAGGSWLFSWLVKRWLKNTYRRWSTVPNQYNVTGAETAAAILAANEVEGVQITSVKGRLTDHYDPMRDILRLSTANFGTRSVAAMAVSAHEAGHALQDASNDIRLRLRRFMVPLAALGARFGGPLAIAGLLFGSGLLLQLGAIFLAGTLLFQLATLPVEFNASRRALANLERLGLSDPAQRKGVQMVLRAAALTYVAAAASTIAYFSFLLAGGGRRPSA